MREPTLISIIIFGADSNGNIVTSCSAGPTLGVMIEVFQAEHGPIAYFAGKVPEAEISIGADKKLTDYSHADLIANIAQMFNYDPNALIVADSRHSWGTHQLISELHTSGLLTKNHNLRRAYVTDVTNATNARSYLRQHGLLHDMKYPPEAACATGAVDLRTALRHIVYGAKPFQQAA